MITTRSGGSLPPHHYERLMVFIDGTNLFERLKAERIVVASLYNLLIYYSDQRKIVRMYLYTIEQHRQAAKARHGEIFFDNIRVVLGTGVPKRDGNIKEKGVDALLVADLVYHAAAKNFDHALLVSVDTDFEFAIKRVEDFGCRTSVLGVFADVPERLRNACDQTMQVKRKEMIRQDLATEAPEGHPAT